MKKIDEIVPPIREKIEAYETQAPDFDSLFMGEVLGNAPLHQLFQSKLDVFETEAPSFDRLFANQTLGKTAPKKHLSPIWAFVAAVAACVAVIFLLPTKTQMDQRPISQVKQEVVQKKSKKVRIIKKVSISKDLLTQKLESPKVIKSLPVEKSDSKTLETLFSYEESTINRDTLSDQNLTKIVPSKKNNLAVTNKRSIKRSIDEAYALAKTKKVRIKRERMLIGATFNSANRLLSQVNTKSSEDFPMQSIASNNSVGFASLEGASATMLRSASVSRNEWITPDNINSKLDNYKTAYSLPINLGLSISFPLFRSFEIMTGVTYTYMYGKTSGMYGKTSGETTNSTFDLKQELHYIGIPLKLSVSIFKQGRFGAYASFGGAIEKGLSGIQESHVVTTDGDVQDWSSKQSIYGFQTSLSGQLGLCYELNKTFNLYIEPGMSYFLANDQPVSSRTEEPFNFNLGIGLRYRVK
jgi:hypothetical protein